MKNKSRKSDGFTITELIVALAIIAILASVAIPSYIHVKNRALKEADNHSLVVLNQATVAYGMMEDLQNTDIFDGISENPQRIRTLVEAHYLDEFVEAQQSGASFTWEVPSQTWVINGAPADSGSASGNDVPGSGEDSPAPTPQPDDEDDLSGYDNYDASNAYPDANTYVAYDGKLYYNLWYVSENIAPGTDQVWQQVTTDWVYYNIYNENDTAVYDGHTYRARFWTSGQTPEDSEYGPWELVE